MAKAKTIHSCTECGGQTVKWQGQCPHCNAWNTLVEAVAESATPTVNRFSALSGVGKLMRLSEIEAREESRITTGVPEFDRVLGGGLVRGGVVLIGGDPGIGKSTLLLQALCAMAGEHKVLYVSGEESAQQIALRSKRLALDASALDLLAEINLEKIQAQLQIEKPAVAVIDSIQTVYSEQLTSAPGSVAQVRECAAQLTRLAKGSGITIVMVGHVTKEGALAGPRVLEHIVDTVLYFEGDTHSSFRLIRAFKNRFGAVNELGVFAMTEKGLKGVSNPSAMFLSQHSAPVAGSCVLVTQEGTRPLLVEIQALVDDAHAPNPRRLGVGLCGGGRGRPRRRGRGIVQGRLEEGALGGRRRVHARRRRGPGDGNGCGRDAQVGHRNSSERTGPGFPVMVNETLIPAPAALTERLAARGRSGLLQHHLGILGQERAGMLGQNHAVGPNQEGLRHA